MNTKAGSLIAMVGILLGGGAYAAPFIPPAGPTFIQFNNLEQLSVTNSIVSPSGAPEGNWGVFNVSSVQDGTIVTPNEDIGGGPVLFSDDGTTGQISGIFWGITVTSVIPGASTAVLSTGGFLELYWDEGPATPVVPGDTVTNTPSIRTADNVAGDWTDGTFLGRLEFASGIIDGDASTTILGTFFGAGVTAPGLADSFANVVDVSGPGGVPDGVIDSFDGLWAPVLNSDYFFVDTDGDGIRGEAGETRDFRFSNFTNALANWNDPGFPGSNDIVGLRSNDPARAFAVPEPSTLGLLGTSLVAFGLLGWWRRRREPLA